jgi:peptidoglycan/LPS O-acetylase OafA/YrhL
MSATAPRPNIPALTSLRFFAALVVVVYHHRLGQDVAHWAIFDLGYEAVTFFFVLSGFILTYVHWVDANSLRLNISTRAFLVARAARILPAYYFALALAAPFLLYGVLISDMLSWPLFFGGIVSVPLLLQAWVPPFATLWNIPAWSLSVEAFFYALFPAICRTAGHLSALSLLGVAFCAVVGVSVLHQHLLPRPLAFGDPWHHFGAYFPVFHLPQFIFGMAVGRYFIWRRSSIPRRTCELTLAAGLTALGIILLFKANAPWLLRPPILVIVFGAIIFGCAGGAGAITKALSAGWLVLLGEASYATYIVHFPLLNWWQWAQKALRYPLSPSVEFAVSVGTVIAVSLLVMATVEKPARAWIVARFGGSLQRVRQEPAFSN